MTQSEKQLIDLIVDGYSSKQIACKLGIAQQTVKNKISALMRKHNVNNRTHLIVKMVREDMVKL